MLGFFSTAAFALSFLTGPAAAIPALRTRSVTTLTSSQISAYAPFTQLARAAYCESSLLTNWNCGEACAAVPGFQTALTGGDGDAVQLYYVGYWPAEDAVVVGHQGTDPTQLLSDLTDLNFPLTTLNTTLFPGVPSDVEAHEGFLEEHAKTAPIILSTTKSLLSSTGASTVILVGHSLGGALAELDSLFMSLNLPSSVHVKAVTYGTPRVGNPDYATFFDSKVSDFVRIDNELDPIPIVPGRSLGFEHPHGEIHIVSDSDEDWVACPGDDDATDPQCTIMSVPNVLESDILDHLGPYDGIYLGTIYCT